MEMFSTDSDLLGYEPGVFVDLGFVGQRKLMVSDGVIDGCELSSTTGGFSDLSAGDVAVLEVTGGEKASYGVESVEDNNTLTLGRAPVGLGGSSGLSVEVITLEPQRELVHEELLTALTDDEDEQIEAGDVLSVDVVNQLEALGTLWLGYVGAVGMGTDT